MKRKILAGLLSLCMMVSLVPTAAFAEEATPAEGTPVVCAGVAETECLAEEHIEGCDKYVAPKTTEEPAPTETPAEEPVVASLEEETPAPVAETTNVAEVNGVGYATLKAAIEAAKAGDTVKILTDIADVTVDVNKNITITAAEGVAANNVAINAVEGCTELTVSNISFTGNSWINSGAADKLTVSGVTADVTPSNTSYTNSRSAFISLGRSEAKVLDLTVENCSIVSRGGSDPILGWAKVNEVVLKDNTFGSADAYQTNSDSVKFMAIADGAEFTITGNTIYSNYNGIVFAQNTTRDNAYTATLDGNTFMGGADHIWIEISGGNTVHCAINAESNNTVNGNAITADDIKAHTGIKNWTQYAGVDVKTDAEGKVIGGTLAYYGEEAIADGYEVVADGEVKEKAPVAVAEVNGVGYATLAAAIEAANGTTVTLLKNVTVTEPIKIPADKTLTLDLNGKTIEADLKSEGRHHYAIDNYGTLTMVGTGEITARGVENFGTLTLDGEITIKSIDKNGGSAIWNEGTFTMNKGTLATGEDGNGDQKGPAALTNAGGVVTVNDGVIAGNSDRCYAVINGSTALINTANNADSTKNIITINNATVSSGFHGVVAVTKGKVVINDGVFTCYSVANQSDHTIYVAGTGIVEINGGKFVHISDGTNKVTGDKLLYGDNITVNTQGKHTIEVTNSSAAAGEVYASLELHKLTAVAETAATCTTAGTKAHDKCDACGKLFIEGTEVTAESLVIPATGHSFGSWKTTKGATCARAGEETRTCSCGATEVRTTAKSADHGYGADGKCATCGAADPNYVAPVATPAPAPTAKPTTAPTATPAPEATPEATPAPEMPKEADTTITEVVAKEEVVEAVKETVTVTEGTATVETETVEAVIEATEEDAPVVLPLAQVTEETAEVVNKAEVATEALETVAEAEKDVVIELTDVTVMLDAEAVKAITEQAEGKTIEIRAVKTETHTLTEKQQATLADKDTAIVVTAQIFSDGEYIGDFKGGKATIMLPFQPEEGKAAEDYAVYFIDDHGELVAVPAEYVDGHMVFTTVHFSDYVIVYEGEAFGGSTEIVVPEAPAAESGFPVLPIAIVIAIIIIGGVIILMKKKNAEE